MGELEAESDDVVFWRRRSLSTRIGLDYADFGQTSDAEVIELLGR
jgi:predicted phosphoribosyltransferase